MNADEVVRKVAGRAVTRTFEMTLAGNDPAEIGTRLDQDLAPFARLLEAADALVHAVKQDYRGTHRSLLLWSIQRVIEEVRRAAKG